MTTGGTARSPRAPSSTLVVDANIVLSAALGRRSRPVFERVIASRTVVTTARAAQEVGGVLQSASVLPAVGVERVSQLLAGVPVVEEAVYGRLLEVAGQVLQRAVASRNGSTRDAHLLACAWAFDADLWTHDRDFGGTGWPSWSNGNLIESLRPNPA